MKGPQPQKGRKAKATVLAHWDKHFLRDVLSELAVKRAKNFCFSDIERELQDSQLECARA